MVRKNFAGMNDGAIDEDREAGGFNEDVDFLGGDLGGIKVHEIGPQLVGSHAGGFDLANERHGDLAVASDLLGGIEIGRTGEGDLEGISLAQDDSRVLLLGERGGRYVVGGATGKQHG